MNGVLREALRQTARRVSSSSTSATTRFHTSAKTQMSGYDYEHAPNMYNLDRMSNRGLKFGLGIFGGLAVGTAVPWIAVQWQQKKAQG